MPRKMKKGMMISCEDTTELVIRKSQEKLSLWNKYRLMFHLAMCKFCSLFEKQNSIIDQLAANLDEKQPEKMPEPVRQNIMNELSK
jgi:hypothetical protein